MNSDEQPMALTYSQAGALMGVSERTVKRMVKMDPDFPRPRKLGPRSSRLLRPELEEYIATRPKVELDEPPQLAAARAAKAAGLSIAPAPFNGGIAS